MLKTPKPIGNLDTLTEDQKFESLYYLIQLMKSDGQVFKSEISFCEKNAEKLATKNRLLKNCHRIFIATPNHYLRPQMLMDKRTNSWNKKFKITWKPRPKPGFLFSIARWYRKFEYEKLRILWSQDFPSINGTDYLELYVGNAKQSALFYQHCFGFELVVCGPETGVKEGNPRMF